MSKLIMNMYESDNDQEHDQEYDWETRSFYFESDDESDEKFKDIIDVESVRKYVKNIQVHKDHLPINSTSEKTNSLEELKKKKRKKK